MEAYQLQLTQVALYVYIQGSGQKGVKILTAKATFSCLDLHYFFAASAEVVLYLLGIFKT